MSHWQEISVTLQWILCQSLLQVGRVTQFIFLTLRETMELENSEVFDKLLLLIGTCILKLATPLYQLRTTQQRKKKMICGSIFNIFQIKWTSTGVSSRSVNLKGGTSKLIFKNLFIFNEISWALSGFYQLQATQNTVFHDKKTRNTYHINWQKEKCGSISHL